MNYNPAIHNRRSLRLEGYDYSTPGLYFITICCQDRFCLFGAVENRKMHLNDGQPYQSIFMGDLVQKGKIEQGKSSVTLNKTGLFYLVITDVKMKASKRLVNFN